jgi:hypothetical protein
MRLARSLVRHADRVYQWLTAGCGPKPPAARGDFKRLMDPVRRPAIIRFPTVADLTLTKDALCCTHEGVR